MVLDAGKEYWTILKRFHRYRVENPHISAAAVRDMRRLETSNPAILRRTALFIAQHSPHSGSPIGSGPQPA